MAAFLSIDYSELDELISGVKKVYTDREFNQLMYRVMVRAASKTKTLVKQEAPVEYYATGAWVGSNLGSPKITTGGNGAGCVIPVSGARGRIGRGSVFTASASGATGRSVRKAYSRTRKGRARNKYTVSAKIVKSGTSTLPSGEGRVHFMVFSGRHRGQVYVRLDKKGKHIRPAVGIGVPQMPMNRNMDAIQRGIVNVLHERIVHEHQFLLAKYCGKFM